jgi:hypothetical protein
MSIVAGRLIPLYFKQELTVVHVTFFLSLDSEQFLLSSEISLFSDPKTVYASIPATGRDLFMNEYELVSVVNSD